MLKQQNSSEIFTFSCLLGLQLYYFYSYSCNCVPPPSYRTSSSRLIWKNERCRFTSLFHQFKIYSYHQQKSLKQTILSTKRLVYAGQVYMKIIVALNFASAIATRAFFVEYILNLEIKPNKIIACSRNTVPIMHNVCIFPE